MGRLWIEIVVQVVMATFLGIAIPLIMKANKSATDAKKEIVRLQRLVASLRAELRQTRAELWKNSKTFREGDEP